MTQITHIRLDANNVEAPVVKHADIEMSQRSILDYLGVDELTPMDSYQVHPGPTDSTIIVELAQPTPWTWEKHIIVTS